jgi:signal transduction histidine kinase
MRVGQSLALTIGVLLVFAMVGIGLALLANAQLNDRRDLLLDEIGPSLRFAIKLEDALVNEETGVRGYLITTQPSFLEPYREGVTDEADAYRELRARESSTGSRIAAEVEAVSTRAQEWREQYVLPTLRKTGRARHGLVNARHGKALFDALRRPLERLQSDLTNKDTQTRRQLDHAANVLQLALLVAAALIIGSVLGAGLFLRQMVTRPLARLGAEARRVAGGEFTTPLAAAAGPREIADVAAEMEAMRERIVRELAVVQEGQVRLAKQADELTRSNAELEQFAYVASHDLQEPLRKIASFCQALKLRYHGQLDDRADQYIDFAVDGAKRMQVLINALLALSRVGRGAREFEQVELEDVLETAKTSLATDIQATGARVLAQPLPAVQGDRTLLVSLFQNLIGNAIKFRGAAAPVMSVACERGAGEWRLSFTDNGIGIDPDYAERIFQIFQRLHTREAYEGTGIGLALCRKIVEHHGGRIWLDPEHSDGARFRLTLPTAKETSR